jgi:nucleotide-binding universal stress UspA family protein
LRRALFSSMKNSLKPFQKIVVAYDDSPAAREALSAGMELCKLLGTPLETITVIEPPPLYAAFVVAADLGVAHDLENDRRRHHQALMESAIAEGRRRGVEVSGHLVETGEVEGVISFLRDRGADLLVIGLRRHSSHVARLWSTVSSLEQEAPCNVLAIRAFSDKAAAGQHLLDEERIQSVSKL